MSLVVVALSLPSCEDGGDDAQVRNGGSITIAQTSRPDFLDPALSYTAGGWEPMWLVYTPPVTYKRAEGEEGTELIPGLAKALPEVSEDGRTVSFRFRHGLRFSDGTPLEASDFEHTIKRVLMLKSGGSGFYLDIAGAREYVDQRDPRADVSGIETDDRSGEVTIHLTRPDGTFLNVLAMDFAGVVPDDTPFRNMSDHPPPGIGPYRITTSVPSREFVLERNDRFAIPGIPSGHLARITTRIVGSPEREATMVIRGDLDYMLEPPPTDLLPQIRLKYKDRYEEHVTDSTYYFFMNVRLPPFDRRPVRQAVNYAIDSRALARLFGGRLTPACNFLPPGVPGYRTLHPCPYGDPDGPGELDKARELVEQAGAAGEPVTVWTHTDGVAQPVGEYLEDVLDEIGLDAELEAVDGAVFVQIVGNPRTRAQIGFANWFPDFPHPANVLYAVDGDTIQSANNQNFGNIDDPEVNRLIDDVNSLPAEEATAPAARADRRLVEEAFVAPYGSERLSTFFSERMDFEHCSRFHPVYHNDYSSFCLR